MILSPSPKRFARFAAAVLTGVAVSLFAPATARAQQTETEADKMAIAYNAAMQAFQAQQWAAAAAGIEKVLVIAAATPALAAQLAPAYFTLGAAYFNTPNYPKAIETFELFLTKFPAHDRVTDVRFSLAQAYTLNKLYGKALKLYEQLEAVPALRDKSLMAQVGIYKIQGKQPDVIRILEKLSSGEITTTLQARGALLLAELFAEAEEPERAIAMLKKLATKADLIDNLVSLNTVAFKLGDAFLERKKYPDALSAYRTVHPRERVLKFQTDRIAMLERRVEANIKAMTGNPQLFAQAQMQNNELKAMIAESKALLAEFEKMPDYAPGLLFRQARCWLDWEKKWETLVVYDHILKKFPQAKEREQVAYGMVITYGDLNQVQSTQRMCDLYLKEFPDGPNAGTVGYMMGAVSLQAGDPKSAETFFGIMLEKQPNSPFRDQMQYLLGNAKFAQGKWPEAMAEYQKYMTTFPKGENLEEVEYRISVTNVFMGKYEEAMKGINVYLSKYDKGLFRPDAKYRLAVCYYAASQFEDVIKQCESWVSEFPKDDMRGEVYSLLGDALAATNRQEAAIRAYIESFKVATIDEVINYSLFEASKLQQKLGQWEELRQMFEDFVVAKPDHSAAIAALYWIGKAKAKLGDEEGAKTYLVEQLKKHINEPKREAVEQILAQLAQLCAKRPRVTLAETAKSADAATASPAVPQATAVPKAAPSAEDVPATPGDTAEGTETAAPAGAAPAPAPAADTSSAVAEAPPKAPASPTDAGVSPPVAEPIAPVPPPYDHFAALDRHLAPVAAIANKTGQARLLYARAELATLKNDERERERIYSELAERFTTEELSPVLLAYVGDYLLSRGTPQNRARAAERYMHLKEDFLKSDYLDFAYVGLGEIAFAEGKYDKALELFTDAIEKVGASLKMKEAMVGKAKALLELGKYDESRKLFEQIASIREWRGDTTAMAVFSLGEIERRRGKFPEAIAHYRRVFVAYQKYVGWVAKSYLRCAEAFEKLGKRQDAVDNLQEMVRNEKLQKLPEMEQARKRLEELGAA